MATTTRPSRSERATALAGVAVIVPARDDEQSLRSTLGSFRSVGQAIVVTNRFADVISEAATGQQASVVHEPRRGCGSACLRGLAVIEDRIAMGEKPPEVVVFLNAEHIQQADLLTQFVRPILEGEIDFVLGSRMLGPRTGQSMPFHAVWSNRMACFLIRHLFGGKYTDVGPVWAIDYYALKFLAMSDRNFGWTIEMQIKAVRARLRIREIPVAHGEHVGHGGIRGAIQGAISAGRILYTIAKCRVLSRARLSSSRK
jgi:hypothetical protein